jgi:hypothetical protein
VFVLLYQGLRHNALRVTCGARSALSGSRARYAAAPQDRAMGAVRGRAEPDPGPGPERRQGYRNSSLATTDESAPPGPGLDPAGELGVGAVPVPGEFLPGPPGRGLISQGLLGAG